MNSTHNTPATTPQAKGQRSSEIQVARNVPQAIDLEQAVLGAIILERDALAKVINHLSPQMFYKPAHSKVYSACLELFNAQMPIDLHTMTQQLRQSGELEAVGGPVYLAELTGRVTGAANVEYHAHIIKEKFIRRRMIGMNSEMQTKAYDETIDVFDLLDEAEMELYRLSGDNLKTDAEAMNTLVELALKHLEYQANQKGGLTGIVTPFDELNEMTGGWQNTDLVVIAARPSMGKTAFALSLARHASITDSQPVLVFSLEMSKQQLAQRILLSECEIDAQKARTGQLEQYEWNKLLSKGDALQRAPLWIDDTPGLNIYDIRSKARRLKSEHGIKMVVVDYLQLMGTGEEKNLSNREREIAKISRALKMLAKELQIPVIALSQLSRAVESRPDKRPMLSDLRESGAIEQDADMVMFLYRPEYYNLEVDEEGNSTAGICEVIIGKQRNGPVGSVKLQFINKFGTFQELKKDDKINLFGSEDEDRPPWETDDDYTTGGFDIQP